jgi:Flp pilus assembly protein TadB
MEPAADARREVALEVQKLAEDFERDDEAAFRRSRIACWVITAVVTIIMLGMIALGGDARYLGLIIVGVIWAGYALSSRRQRQQTGRLRALAARWLSAGPTISGDRGAGSDLP